MLFVSFTVGGTSDMTRSDLLSGDYGDPTRSISGFSGPTDRLDVRPLPLIVMMTHMSRTKEW